MRTRDRSKLLLAIAILATASTLAQEPTSAKHEAKKRPLAKTSVVAAMVPAKAVPARRPESPTRTLPKRVEKLPEPEADVMIVALGSLSGTTRTEIEHTARRLVGGATSSANLRDVQMTIVRKTAPFGPVIVLTADETTKARVLEDCANWKLCDLITSGSVQLRVVNHESPWIRDYGPQIEIGKSGPRVVHWRYYDTRQDDSAMEMRSRVNEERLHLIEHAFKNTSGKEASIGDLLESEEQAAAEQAKEDRALNLLAQMDSVLANSSVLQRNTDDRSAFDIAEAVLSSPRFEYVAPDSFVDGGNLIHMGDGRCLTTRTLLSRNKDVKVALDQELIAKGSCSQVIYLDPLPGPVIEHIDMFALPAGPKKVLLASFDLHQNYTERYWGELTPEQKTLTFDAAVAMKGNARRLRDLGYEVIEVPSPLPRDDDDGVYYPTVLNALVRFNGRGGTQILVPVYEDYEDDVQAAAMETIKNAFGPNAQVVPIDATEAAKLQGAVHCLTLTLPMSVSVFADTQLDNERHLQVARREELEQELGNREIPNDLSGTWFYVEEHDAYKRSAASAETFEFSGNSVIVDSNDGDDPAKGTYEVTRKADANWEAALKFPETELDAKLKWIDADHVRIVLEELDEPHVLVRKKPVSTASSRRTEK
jgi:agmatine/peptidylarginine deiminase